MGSSTELAATAQFAGPGSLDTMLLGVTSSTWKASFNNEEVNLLQRAAEIGFDVVETRLEDPFRASAPYIQQAAEEAGLKISVLTSLRPEQDISHEAYEVRQAGIDYLKFFVDLAAAVGSDCVSGPLYSGRGKVTPVSQSEIEKEFKRAALSLHEIAYYAGLKGIKLAIEPLNRFENRMVNTVEQALDLCAEIDLDNVGLMLNTFHMNIEENCITDSIKVAGEHLFHVHACENHGGILGSGHIEWVSFFNSLAEIGYENTLVFDWRPAASMLRSVKQVKTDDDSHSADYCARESLDFLKQQLEGGRTQ